MDSISIQQQPEENRFALLDGEAMIGEAAYVQHGDRRIFYHTVVDPAYGGRGLAGDLVASALRETMDAGVVVVPVCPYVRSWLERHPDVAERTQQPEPADLDALRAALGD